MKNTSSNTSTNNARPKRQEPYDTIDRKLHEQNQLQHKMQGVIFHDPDEQSRLELEQLENGRMGKILPIRREAYALPIDPDIQIYRGEEGALN